MKNIIWVTWLGWWRTPGRIMPLVVLMFIAACGPCLTMTFTPDAEAPPCNGLAFGTAAIVALFSFTAGIISRERESGTIATIFSRPINRSTYVLAKWLALASAAIFVGLMNQLVSLLVYGFTIPSLIHWSVMPLIMVQSSLIVFGMSAVFILCSSIGSSNSDLSTYLASVSAAFLIMMIGQTEVPASALATLPAWTVSAYQVVRSFCMNVTEPLWFFLIPFFNSTNEWEQITSQLIAYFSNITLTLTAAILLMNKREVGYGHSG